MQWTRMPCPGDTVCSVGQCAHRATKMKRMLCLAAITYSTVMLFCASPGTERLEQKTPMVYELYSWQGSNGGWNFCLLYNTSSEKTVQEVFSKKTELRGLGQLKHRISALPVGSSIVWVD